MDMFQDYLFHLEDNPLEIQSYDSAVAWNYPDASGELDQETYPKSLDEKLEEIKPSPSTVLQWISG